MTSYQDSLHPDDPGVRAAEDQVRAQMRDRMQSLLDMVETEVASAGGSRDPIDVAQLAYTLGVKATLSSFIDAVFQGKCHPDGIRDAQEQICAERVLLQGLLDFVDETLERKEVSPPWERPQAK